MATTNTQSMPREQFLTIAVNLLHRAFIEATRTDAKHLFKVIAEGKRAALTQVRFDDKSQVRFDLSLDHSEYEGSLNYSGFRTSLDALLGNIAQALREKRQLATYGAEGDPNNMIFGVAGVSAPKSVPAVLVLSASTAQRDASVLLRLMYLDYEQFLRSQQQVQAQA